MQLLQIDTLFQTYVQAGTAVLTLAVIAYVMYKYFTNSLKEEKALFIQMLADQKAEYAERERQLLQSTAEREKGLNAENKELNLFVKEMSIKHIESYNRFAKLVEDLLQSNSANNSDLKHHFSQEIGSLKTSISENIAQCLKNVTNG